MPPKIRITKDAIIDAAIQIVKEHGIEKLNARNLANELGCSVQPIFREFATMDDLKKAVAAKVGEIYSDYLLRSISPDGDLAGLEMAYIHFAQEEKNLFRLLHLSDRLGIHTTQEFTSVGVNRAIIQEMARITNLTTEEATILYTGTFFTAHGIASMLATNHCTLEEEEIRTIIESVFDGLIIKLRAEKATQKGDCE